MKGELFSEVNRNGFGCLADSSCRVFTQLYSLAWNSPCHLSLIKFPRNRRRLVWSNKLLMVKGIEKSWRIKVWRADWEFTQFRSVHHQTGSGIEMS